MTTRILFTSTSNRATARSTATRFADGLGRKVDQKTIQTSNMGDTLPALRFRLIDGIHWYVVRYCCPNPGQAPRRSDTFCVLETDKPPECTRCGGLQKVAKDGLCEDCYHEQVEEQVDDDEYAKAAKV